MTVFSCYRVRNTESILTALIIVFIELKKLSPRSSTPQSSSCTATYHPPRKLLMLDEPDMRDNTGGSKDELISDVFLWTPSHGRAKVGRPAWTYIKQLCVDMGCSPEDLPEQWTIETGGEKESGISVLMVRHDDDDDETFLIDDWIFVLLRC